jgi:hypothetical protein
VRGRKVCEESTSVVLDDVSSSGGDFEGYNEF